MEAGNLAALAGLDALTLAIGDDAFDELLFAAASTICQADHVIAFAISAERSPRIITCKGTIDPALATACATDYVRSLYLLDPHYPAMRALGGEIAWFDYDCHRNADHFETAFLAKLGANDVIGVARRHSQILCVLLLMKLEDRTFAPNHRWLLSQVDGVVMAALIKHFNYVHALGGHNEFVMDQVLAKATQFTSLTPRERVVCLGILTGYTSESIGINLSISVNSVLTYRKRAYEKLKISSQNELFMKMIAAMIDFGRDDSKSASQGNSTRPLDTQTFGPERRFNEYYMAEAFLGDDIN